MTLDREEFLAYIELLQKSVDEGFAGVHRRQDTTNGRINTSEERINILFDRVGALEQGSSGMTRWGAIAGGIGVAIGGLLTWLAK